MDFLVNYEGYKANLWWFTIHNLFFFCQSLSNLKNLVSKTEIFLKLTPKKKKKKLSLCLKCKITYENQIFFSEVEVDLTTNLQFNSNNVENGR